MPTPQIKRQPHEVVGLLGAAQGFRKVTSGQKGIAARRVVAQVLHSLSKLGDALGGILPTQVYVQAAGQVLQHVLQTIIGRLGTTKLLCCDTLKLEAVSLQAKGSGLFCRPNKSDKQRGLSVLGSCAQRKERRVAKTCPVRVDLVQSRPPNRLLCCGCPAMPGVLHI